MRFATYRRGGSERFGLVVRHPRDGADWVFDPAGIEALADALVARKGAGSRWHRPAFLLDGAWPPDLAAFLRLGAAGTDAARRMADFVARYLEQGDPLALRGAALPVADAELQAPIPRPRLLLGVVGNNAAFLRNDPPRGRNLDRPSCHQRPWTSVVGPEQPIVVPAGSDWWAGTAELGVVIGAGGRDIPHARAFDHVAGYTVVNDGLADCYTRRWAELDRATGFPPGGHFHAANTASWLGKAADTMCALGPYLVTPEEVGDPYDLLCHFREGGVVRGRAHSGALVCGIEELIAWLSRFVTLEPGMVLHLGAMGQDGIVADAAAATGPGYRVEAAIERVGTLSNPLIFLEHGDWRGADEPRRWVHPVPTVRELRAVGRDRPIDAEEWRPGDANHFWTLAANFAGAEDLVGIAPRPYPLAYAAPPGALAASGATVRLPSEARTITVACELGLVIGAAARGVTAAEAAGCILGYVALAVLRDSAHADALIAPHFLDANMPVIYDRWADGCNVAGPRPAPLETSAGRRMSLAVDGVGAVEGATDAYLLDGPAVVAALSAWITLLPGDVIALGPTGPTLTIPADRPLPAGTALRAEVARLPPVTALLDDRRRSATSDPADSERSEA